MKKKLSGFVLLDNFLRLGSQLAPTVNVWRNNSRLLLQILAVTIIPIVLPLFTYIWLAKVGVDITGIVYFAVVGVLLFTAYLIADEGLRALRRVDPPVAASYPPATAIIAAYLPNEATIILDTIESFQAIEYPGGLQIILAYNTPRSMPIEAELRAIAAQDPRFRVMKVAGSTSKAQNINTALAKVSGEIVGIFDADHHPSKNSFIRAWEWLFAGYDVVQGHNVIRNGLATWLTPLIAVEFEVLYAVNHPGRARQHDFAIFGGSNGYWRTEILRDTRMHSFMLTEDIDASLRAILSGHTIVSDPYLVSEELAPITVAKLWNQRLRWAQGWFQVALLHSFSTLRSSQLSLRQKFGCVHLLLWSQIYPWLSIQVFPIIIYRLFFAQHRGVDWLIPIFVLTTIFTLGTGPLQTFFAYRLAVPKIRIHKKWFLYYLLASSPLYDEFKSLVTKVAQLKQIMKEDDWRVTPREDATRQR